MCGVSRIACREFVAAFRPHNAKEGPLHTGRGTRPETFCPLEVDVLRTRARDLDPGLEGLGLQDPLTARLGLIGSA